MPENTAVYSKKEIAVFDGLFSIAASGKPFSSIKVQDIATAAGVGKGTLYEYFSSKEEILSRAILYTLEILLEWMEKQLAGEASLLRTLDVFLDELENEQILPFSSLAALSTIVSAEQKQEFDEQNHDKVRQIFEQMRACEKQFFEAGRRNGEIAMELDDNFCEYVIISALFGMAGKNLCVQQQGRKANWKLVYQMVFRALRP